MLWLLLLPTALASLNCDVLEVSLKSPDVAFKLSTVTGFGTGHFYAHNYKMGVVAAVLQVGGAAFFAGGLAGDAELQDRRTLLGVGSTLFGVGRFADIATAPGSTEAFNRDLVRECRARAKGPPKVDEGDILGSVLDAMGIAKDGPQADLMQSWVAHQIYLGLSGDDIMRQALAGEGPVQP